MDSERLQRLGPVDRHAGSRRALTGLQLPRIELPAWPEGPIRLRERWQAPRSLILSLHPGLSLKHGGIEPYLVFVQEWSERVFEFELLGYDVALLTARRLDEQAWLDIATPRVAILSDERLQLADALGLPTLQSEYGRVYEALTLIVHECEIGQVLASSSDARTDVDATVRFVRATADKE